MKPELMAMVDAIVNKMPVGNLAARLLQNNMDPSKLRTNSLLRDREWVAVDEAAIAAARVRLVGVADLLAAGLTTTLNNGLGTMILESEKVGNMAAASVSMAAEADIPEDRVTYGIDYLPLPIIHHAWHINIRNLYASRMRGDSVDVTQAEDSAMAVGEAIESMLFNGYSSLQHGPNAILYGLRDFPSANTGTLTTPWDASVGNAIVDVLAMKQENITAKHFGDVNIYVPTAYDTHLDEDYVATTSTTITVRDRIKMIGGVRDIKVADQLADTYVAMVEMMARTIRMVIGMQPTNIEWETKGGLVSHFMHMAIMIPQPRADKNGNCGITVYSES